MFFRKTIIFRGSRGGPTFSREWGRGEGVQLFPRGGVQVLFSIETYQNWDFQAGGPDSLSPLWICESSAFTCSSYPVIDLHIVGVRGWWEGTKFSQASPVSQRCVLKQDTFIL